MATNFEELRKGLRERQMAAQQQARCPECGAPMPLFTSHKPGCKFAAKMYARLQQDLEWPDQSLAPGDMSQLMNQDPLEDHEWQVRAIRDWWAGAVETDCTPPHRPRPIWRRILDRLRAMLLMALVALIASCGHSRTPEQKDKAESWTAEDLAAIDRLHGTPCPPAHACMIWRVRTSVTDAEIAAYPQCVSDPSGLNGAGRVIAVDRYNAWIVAVDLDGGCHLGTAVTSGPNSPAVTGDGNTVTYGK